MNASRIKVGLINIEPKVVNTALMQVANYHRQRGNYVAWADPEKYDYFDKLYCSSLFDFTDKTQVPERAICGGTGFDLTTKLGFDCGYDYSIYPECDFSLVWFSRGCIRNCPFCIVQKKEGAIHTVNPKPLNLNGTQIKVQDNNFFASEDWRGAIRQLHEWGQPVDFHQGIDVRLITDEILDALCSLKMKRFIRIAWDNPRLDLTGYIRKLTSRIKPYRIMCYVLIGYWSTPEEDLYRIETLRGFGIDPFVMPFNKKDPYQKRFARWVNMKAIFKTVKWEDYSR